MPAQQQAPDLLRPREAAQILDVHTVTLANWRKHGGGPRFIKLGSGLRSPVRYDRADVDAYLKARRSK